VAAARDGQCRHGRTLGPPVARRRAAPRPARPRLGTGTAAGDAGGGDAPAPARPRPRTRGASVGMGAACAGMATRAELAVPDGDGPPLLAQNRRAEVGRPHSGELR
jgi:hypothetical protein